MKNQYFGDINDYKKYGLLRVLSNHGTIQTAICWMLTQNDGRNDGTKISYLQQREQWRQFDPELFDFLYHSLTNDKERNLRNIEQTKILPASTFYSPLLSDNTFIRNNYFSGFLSENTHVDLVFYDPDNGIEVKSKKKGMKESNKYIFWDEIQTTIIQGHSVLLYQHYPRIKHSTFEEMVLEKIRLVLQGENIFVISTSNVAYFLIAQRNHVKYFDKRMLELSKRWNNIFTIKPSLC